MATTRLTEEEVHATCAEIAAQGERPTALKLLDELGRGSLTTITKYLNSWNQTEEAQSLEADSLPVVIKLPETLSKEGDDLLKRMWNTAKGIADEELEIQREALKQAEKDTQARVKEAFAFSEAQALKIERLETALEELKEQLANETNQHHQTVAKLNDAEKTNVGLVKDNDQLHHKVGELKKQVAALEESNKAALQEQQDLQKEHVAVLKQKDAEIRSLDIQVHKLQSSLDSIVKANDQLKTDIKGKTSELSDRVVELEKLSVRYEAAIADLNAAKADLKKRDAEIKSLDMQVHKLQTSLDSTAKANDQLKTDIKSKTADLSNRVVELEKLSVRYEATIADLNTAKSDLKAANKVAFESEKRVSKLEGQLEVYIGLEKPVKPSKSKGRHEQTD